MFLLMEFHTYDRMTPICVGNSVGELLETLTSHLALNETRIVAIRGIDDSLYVSDTNGSEFLIDPIAVAKF